MWLSETLRQVRNWSREEKDKSRQEALYRAVQSDVVRPFSGEIYWDVQSIGLWTPFGCASMYLTRVIKSDLLSGSVATSSDRIAQSNWFVDIYWDCSETPMIYLKGGWEFWWDLEKEVQMKLFLYFSLYMGLFNYWNCPYRITAFSWNYTFYVVVGRKSVE